MSTRYRARITKAAAGLLSLGLLVAACGGNSGTKTATSGGPQTTTGGQSQGNDTAENMKNAKPGGSITLALEAETTGGWCLPEAQLAAGGIQVARAIYDTLTVPDDKGGYIPELATSVTSNPDFTAWTIKLRSGIKFHDGTSLDATVVKNNLDAYSGRYKGRSPLLFIFVFQKYIKAVKVIDPATVEVDMTSPWSTFPAHLYEYGRLGMMAQKQLSDGKNCFNDMIGTGPFMFKGDWTVGEHLTVVKNPTYWRKDAQGNALPYLDKITFKVVLETSALRNGIESGQLDAAVSDNDLAIKPFMDAAKAGKINLKDTDQQSEIGYTIFNEKKLPFSNIHARKAWVYAFDSKTYNAARNNGLLQYAQGPFAPGVLGYLQDTGFPQFDLAKAKTEVAAYTAETHKALSFSLATVNDSDSLTSAQLAKSFMTAAGMQVNIHQAEQSQYINDVIAGSFDAAGWRNHPGFDPDTQYVWWHCDNPAPATQPTDFATAKATCNNLVNFSGFNDAVINKALDDARATSDPAARKQAYEDLNKEFAKQVWEAWSYYVIWAVPYSKHLHGVNLLKLPTADSVNAVGNNPFPGFSSGIDPAGLWLDNA